MADPLSLTASIIAVVGAADEVTKGLRRLKAAKGAPKGLQDLLEDVEQLEMVLNCVKSTVLGSGSPPIELATLTGEAGSKLLELRSLIEYTLTKAGASDKVDRWQWLRKVNEVERLRNQLGTIRLNLLALTCSANFGVLQRVSIVTQDLSSEQQQLNAQITSVLPRQEALLSHLCQRIEESQATQVAMMRLLGDFRQTDVNVALDNSVARPESLESAAITPIVARPRLRSRSEFHIQNLQIQAACPTACTCDCHETWTIYTPRNLRKLFGNSKIEGAEFPFFRGACSLRSCKGKRGTFINISFFLPTMMAARMISLWFTSSPLYGPELLLRAPRVSDTRTYVAICSGDLDTVKEYVFAGDLKPWDVDHIGQSLIRVALNFGNFTTALFLAQVASDNYDCLREDYRLMWYGVFDVLLGRFCPMYHDASIKATAMSQLILALKNGKEETCSPLVLDIVPRVDWDEFFDRNGFSKLHKIVYGMTGQSLDAEIEARPEDLDRQDSIGLTALWYACWLGNSDHIRILTHHGADVNNGSISPICAAVWRGSYNSVEQLLNAGASITDRSIDILYQTLMFRRSRAGENVEKLLAIDKALFGGFLDINCRTSIYGRPTPLIALIWGKTSHSLPRMRQLLELGSDTELCDRFGVTPLHHAIYIGNAQGCKILGRAGANANVQDNRCGTILHTAIRFAKHPDIIQAVSEFDLSGVELGAKDVSGCTAFEIFEIRAGACRNNKNVRSPSPSWYFGIDFELGHTLISSVTDLETELDILWSFQALLQQVQEAQGIPIEDRYPFYLTFESTICIPIKDRSPETLMPFVPGAWPEE
ncbi:hypothetical protein JMJ35_006061 [Cladonia borealis]|uniref:Fungal N-terminal domain-containing protein n=1 Tax=Cladonia borealis TaxID=184061 RepID=A0AA39QYH1_9LECA|nr:hypothetical protein JMJ35_006061 [Cladonia borealis]